MNRTHRGLLLLAVLILGACDTGDQPSAAEAVVADSVAVPEAPAPAPVPVVEAVITGQAPTPAAEVTKPAATAAVTKELEPVSLSLDLSLPATKVASSNPADTSAVFPEHSKLLPPLFIDKSVEPSRFQLNGGLITDQTINEITMDAVTGAELKIEFKQ